MSRSNKNFFLGFFLITFFLCAGDSAFADVYSVSFLYDSKTDNLQFDYRNGSAIVIDSTKSLSQDFRYQMYPDGLYEADFISMKGYDLGRKRFNVISGYFSVDFPYVSIAKTLNIYKLGSQDILLTYDISQFMTCFVNGVCEYEKGENLRTCASDCASDSVQFSDETKKLLKRNNDVIRDPKSGEVLLQGIQVNVATPVGVASTADSETRSAFMLVGGIAGILISVGVIVLMRLRARNKRYGL